MMHMYPYNNNLYSFEGESSFVRAQGFPKGFPQGFTQNFPFQQQNNWNIYNQLSIDPSFISDNTVEQTDRNIKRKKSNHVYSNFTIPSITSIIPASSFLPSSSLSTLSTLPLSLLSSLQTNNNDLLTQQSLIPSKSISPMEVDSSSTLNMLDSLNSLSYFSTPDKDTTISLQDITDGMKVMQEISRDLTTYSNYNNNNLFHDAINNLVTDLNENPVDWLIQENRNEMSKQFDTLFDFNVNETTTTTTSSHIKQFCQDVDDLIDEHMEEIKKIIHNEILCQEILTDSSFQDLIETNKVDEVMSSTSTTSCHIIKKDESSQETIPSDSSLSKSSLSSLPLSYTTLTSEEITNPQSCTGKFKCNEVGCNREYDCYTKLKSHKVTHTSSKPFICNVLGCNKKFKRSGELTKHQLDHLHVE